jgi:hypothetical protein
VKTIAQNVAQTVFCQIEEHNFFGRKKIAQKFGPITYANLIKLPLDKKILICGNSLDLVTLVRWRRHVARQPDRFCSHEEIDTRQEVRSVGMRRNGFLSLKNREKYRKSGKISKILLSIKKSGKISKIFLILIGPLNAHTQTDI